MRMRKDHSHGDSSLMPPAAGPLDPEIQRLVALRDRKDNAVMCLMLGVMLLFFSVMANSGGYSPPTLRDANGRPVLDANGREVRKPTITYYVMQALLPWNVAIGASFGLFVAAGVVRFRPVKLPVQGGASA